MTLSKLIEDALGGNMPFNKKELGNFAGSEVLGITDDSRKIKPGMVFVCIKGTKFDGHTVASEMLEKGALCVITEKDLGLPNEVSVPDSREFYGYLCSAFFGHPEKSLRIVGVTGTNGKTTMTSMIDHILTSDGHKVGYIGTTGADICGVPLERDDSTPTSPKVYEFFEMLSKMKAAGCEFVVMEVSSFAMEQNRIGCAHFECGVFTNLTRDHLDYHGTMENYYLAKKKLFDKDRTGTAFINTDDEYGNRLFAEAGCEKYSCSENTAADFKAENITHSGIGAEFDLSVSKGGKYHLRLNMPGNYNIMNAVSAMAVCIKLGVSPENTVKFMESFGGVRGRCEVIPINKDFTVICDYAHSPDALENVLPALRENTEGRLICLFGCGGDRDRTKRPMMAKAVEKFADHIIVTSDNPRNENPEAIIDEIVTGFSEGTSYDRIADRKKAIYHGVKIARKGDVLVLAGKGHEDYQILAGGRHIHFDEREITFEAVDMLEKAETLTLGEIASAVGGKLSNADENVKIYSEDISSDTRSIVSGSLFIGIKGENFDGNDFAEKAVKEHGAAAVITNREIAGIPCIITDDTRAALLKLAAYYRKKYPVKIVGVTGSVGKTSVKEMTACALESRYNTLRTEGNRNNEIGLPFTLFRITKDTEAAVIEMGMSHFGEIERLSKTAVPDICVITNIGYSHIENLGSRDGILKAKTEILLGAKENAPLIVNGDDDLLSAFKDDTREIITCGTSENCVYRAVNIENGESGVSFDVLYKGEFVTRCVLPVMGRHYIVDALLAAAAAEKAGCDLAEAIKAMAGYAPVGLRQHIEKKGGQTVITDCYNSAPNSAEAAIDVLAEITIPAGARRISVLGDMLELGDKAPALHAEVGKYAAEKGIDLVVGYGKLAENISSAAEENGSEAVHFTDRDKISDYLKNELKDGDAVLFKGSRGMRMEDIISQVYKE